MKTNIFQLAIHNRRAIRFFYETTEITIDPYFISSDKFGNKYVYGKPKSAKGIEKFEYRKIANIRILNEPRFTPIIPIVPLLN